jgi:high-affinity iron transporter
MLVATGVLLGLVLLVMVGESVQELQLAGWLPAHSIGVAFPGWLGLWFAFFPTVEGLVAQALAAGLVVGSYVLAERRRDGAPRPEPAARRPAPITTLAEEQA